MVKLKQKFEYREDGSIHLDAWINSIEKNISQNDIEIIKQTCELAALESKGLTTFYGQSCLQQGLEIAEIAYDLNLDTEGVAAAILTSTIQHSQHLTLETVSKKLNPNISKLLKSILQTNTLNVLGRRDQTQTDRLRKAILAMASDIRVVVIKLAERLCLMRGIKNIVSTEQKRLAQETMDVFAPLANRLGMGQLKWELEDLSFHYLDPETYKTIAQFLSQKRVQREEHIFSIIQQIRSSLEESGIEGTVSGRVKHIYSIYQKKLKKDLDYKEIFDYNAARILVETVHDCYAVLSVIHCLWEQIPQEFDDYIANPKSNGYQSIHTAVIGPDGKNLEIQIRTRQMHELAEHGVAAHWAYKETKTRLEDYSEKINYIRQLLAWKQAVIQTDSNQLSVLEDRVYVFTPESEIIDLPKGSTPIDFAYQLHTELGHRCRGAKINGHIVQLTYTLQTGDRVEIITIQNGLPSRDWLNPELGYIKTTRARAKISHWFRQSQEQKEKGSEVHEDRLIEKVIPPVEKPIPITSTVKKDISVKGLEIEGVSDLLTRVAKCCKPIPGDTIVGYITQGRGVSIHKATCRNILSCNEINQNKLLEVKWDIKNAGNFYVDLQIMALDDENLLKEITSLLSHIKIRLISLNSAITQRHNTQISLTLEIHDVAELQQIYKQLKTIRSITDIKRL